ncbi:protein-disulfide reductase DsbD domain-containing protein [Larkinella humicola]|uniref:Uncharacterized protein n=1 Tax=Larkinella humicola TaxID=2607654 RepID=A0A5N1JB20_9BACT|nr:protein-disulfide reductase DsbD domain-containing protein [Larkinella humicola]KAA9349595.1 hypothetical protein F0P93_19215 [Larkinella humicola]
MKRFLVLIPLVLLLAGAVADKPVAYWTFKTTPSTLAPAELEPGDEIDLIFTATLDPEWLVYSSDFSADAGPPPTTFEIIPDDSFETVGGIRSVDPRRKKDRTGGVEVSYFESKAEFRQRIRVLSPDYIVKGVIRGRYCSEKKGLSLPFEQLFVFSIQ